jgi:hypothetical protein
VPSWLSLLLLSLAWGPPLVLLHELGHAFAALAVTDGEVKIRMRPGHALLLWGERTYEPESVRTLRSEALIVAAGPAVTLVVAVALGWAAFGAEGFYRLDFGVLQVGAICAAGQLFLTALPLRYGPGLGPSGGESDGRALWRILTGAPPGGVAREEHRRGRPERVIGPVFATILAALVVLAALVDPIAAILLVGMFGIAFFLQRSG